MKGLQKSALALLRRIGHLLDWLPPAPRATGGYGLACRGALLLLFVVGLALAWPLRGAGLVLMMVSALALMKFFLLQYRSTGERLAAARWLSALALAMTVIIGLVWSRWGGRGGAKGDVMVMVTVVAALVVLPLIDKLFRLIFGPHHPESSLPDPEDPWPLWFWIGGVGPDRATIVARLDEGLTADGVMVEYRRGGQTHQRGPVTPDGRRFCRIELDELAPDQRYELRLHAMSGGEPVATSLGSFTTFPRRGRPADVSLAFASCMSTGSRGAVFDTIGQTDPRARIFVVTGDLHYENITSSDSDRFLETYDRVHRSHPQRRLYNSMPMAYVWDDHDYGDNDSDHESPSKQAAQDAYRLAVPHYLTDDPTLPGHQGAIHQEFSIGRVLVLMTDNRSERGETEGQLLSSAAEQWLIERITDRRWPVVIWVSPTPWISCDGTSDNWGAYPDQRRRIAAGIGRRAANLVMVSGDAHMVAIDDGSNSGYDGPDSGFPILHAAALDRLGSVKGGNFSHGKYPGGGQFGLVNIDDRGQEVHVELSGRSWSGAEIINHRFTIAAPG